MNLEIDLNLNPAAAGGARSSAPSGTEVEGSAGPSTPSWTCQDCGLIVLLESEDGLDQANDHWKVCEQPGEDALRRRKRTGLVPGVVPVSPSSLDTYEMCPRQAWFAYQDPKRVRTASGAPADLGTALHTYAETGDGPSAELPAEMAEDWIWMQRTVDRLLRFNPVPGVESGEFRELMLEWTYDLADGRKVEVSGKADRVYVYEDASVLIVDIKSGYAVPEDEDGLETSSNQGRSYPVGALRYFPFASRIMFAQAQLRTGRIVQSKWYTPEEVQVFDRMVEEKAKKYAAEKLWKATPGRHCLNKCDFAHRCRPGTDYLGDAGIQIQVLDVEAPLHLETPDQVRAVYAGLMNALTKAKLMEESLKGAVKAANVGPTALPDGKVLMWDQKVRKVIAKPKVAFDELVKRVGSEEKAWEMVNLDGRKKEVKDLKEKLPDDVLQAQRHPEFGAFPAPKGAKE